MIKECPVNDPSVRSRIDRSPRKRVDRWPLACLLASLLSCLSLHTSIHPHYTAMRRAILSAQRSHHHCPSLQRRAAAGASSIQCAASSIASTSSSSSTTRPSHLHRRELHIASSSNSGSTLVFSLYQYSPTSSNCLSPRRTYATESKQQQQQQDLKKSKENKKSAEEQADVDAKLKKNRNPSSSDEGVKFPIPGLESFFGGKLGQRSSGSQNSPSSSNSSNSSGKVNKGPSFPFGLGQESAKDTEAEHLNKSSSSGGNGDGKGNGNNGAPGPPQGLAPYLFPLAVLILFHFITNSDSSSREITWQEFRTAFLDKGLVDKLTVVNRSKVRVHLHSNATGVLYPQSPAADGRSTYYFSIGSVEAFERKLDEAQGELGIPSTERVPVAYKDETSVASTLLSFAPTLLIVGVLYFLSRRAGGGAGAGGPGGIFGVGKSKAKMFNVSCFTRGTQQECIELTFVVDLLLYRKTPMSKYASKMSPVWTKPRRKSWNSSSSYKSPRSTKD